jgi:ligand-binding SRPBCC domain-containing protein
VSRIECETLIDAPPERCFDLSRSVELHLEAAASTGERAVGGVTSGLLAAGDTVTWEARHVGRRWRLTVRISAYDRPRFFRDEQVRGPFRRMAHDHLFDPRDGGTWMRDVFEFESGFPLLDRLVLAPHLRRFLLRRNALIKHRGERQPPDAVPGAP